MGIAEPVIGRAFARPVGHPILRFQVSEWRDFTSHTRAIASTPVPMTSQSEACLPATV